MSLPTYITGADICTCPKPAGYSSTCPTHGRDTTTPAATFAKTRTGNRHARRAAKAQARRKR